VVEHQRRCLAMTKETPKENLGTNAQLTDSELDSVSGGTPKETKTPPKKEAFEIKDWSFDVTNPL
jgi:hypothetical protein